MKFAAKKPNLKDTVYLSGRDLHHRSSELKMSKEIHSKVWERNREEEEISIREVDCDLMLSPDKEKDGDKKGFSGEIEK